MPMGPNLKTCHPIGLGKVKKKKYSSIYDWVRQGPVLLPTCLRVAQRYVTVVVHTRRRASVLVSCSCSNHLALLPGTPLRGRQLQSFFQKQTTPSGLRRRCVFREHHFVAGNTQHCCSGTARRCWIGLTKFRSCSKR